MGLDHPDHAVAAGLDGSTLIEQNKASLGSIFAFQIYAMLLLQPIWAIVNSVSQTQKTLAAMERIFGVLAMPQDKPDSPNAIDGAGHRRRVSV